MSQHGTTRCADGVASVLKAATSRCKEARSSVALDHGLNSSRETRFHCNVLGVQLLAMAATDATTPRPQPDITLLRGWDDKGCYVWSPFVTKLELRLRLSGISYRTAAGSINTAPTGKIPYVEIHEKDAPPSTPPTKIGDSALIAKYLAEQGLIEDLDAGLRDATARAQDMALRALVEDRLYFFQVRMCVVPPPTSWLRGADVRAGKTDA